MVSGFSRRLLPVLVLLAMTGSVGCAAEPGYTPLFNGKDLSGWTVVIGEPSSWLAENGELVCTGHGADGEGKSSGYIATDGQYADFEMTMEYKVARDGNSGLFLRAGRNRVGDWDPVNTGFEVQILDSLGEEPSVYDAGAIYGIISPSRVVCRPYSRWNQLYVRCVDRDLQVVLNGVKVIDARLDEWPALAQRNWRGHIMLQNHGAEVHFRNLRLRPVKADLPPVFNGDTFDGWQVPSDKWSIENNEMVNAGGGGGWIMTRKKYENFLLRLEYDTTGNSGISFRAAPQGDPAFTGTEIQVLQDSGERPDIHGSMSVYGALSPAQNNTRPAGQWNQVTIEARGRHVKVWQNGVKMHDYDVLDPALNALEIQSSKLRDRVRTGTIGFQDHGSAVRYRNIRLKELPGGGW